MGNTTSSIAKTVYDFSMKHDPDGNIRFPDGVVAKCFSVNDPGRHGQTIYVFEDGSEIIAPFSDGLFWTEPGEYVAETISMPEVS